MERCKNKIIQTRLGEYEFDESKVLNFPHGLMGFETMHSFMLMVIKPGSPFLLLQSLDDPSLGLLVTDPYVFMDEYIVKVSDAEQAILQVKDVKEVTVLVTVSIPRNKPELTTLSLTGPVLINHQVRVGVQVPQIDGKNPPSLRVHYIEGKTGDASCEKPQESTREENTDGLRIRRKT